ncbi:crossover junction endodeoxyribonuclease RuvC [Cognatilysobacter bugurensis]|uniref:Crossover junction endodeoxyribonuclease RuvC n=1 Tax=Cognatilysobacter bugurensis TaxID=543356 RepID=A0A918T0Q4_9GAMM|nr:crossover junction endodeoxyribonuclease RuvC [Lysobacter bugurensis]GHA80743.1 crossover junction endodeoxyribonuclease RuvC [Lysobacter bugurensis]
MQTNPESQRPAPGTTRILGIDPGSQRTGVGLIDVGGDGRCTYVHATALKLLDAADFPARLGLLCEGLNAIVDAWRPTQVAIETVFMDKSATSALKLGHARGAALACVVLRQLPVSEYAPRVIKQSLVGKGAADKVQVQHMVRLLLNLPDAKLQADAADALAVALTHAHMSATAVRSGVATHLLRRR